MTLFYDLFYDPAYQGMNWYAYCGNNPLNCVDPMGLYFLNIPYGVVWDTTGWENGMTGNEDIFFTAVQSFLNDTNLSGIRGGTDVRLTGVTYDNTLCEYICEFEDSSHPLSLGMDNGVKVLMFNGYNVFDGRLGDMIYGTSFCTIDTTTGTGTNTNYKDWLAAKKAAIKTPSKRDWAKSLAGAAWQGANDGANIMVYHDPGTIARYGWAGTASSWCGYTAEGAIAGAAGGAIGTALGRALPALLIISEDIGVVAQLWNGARWEAIHIGVDLLNPTRNVFHVGWDHRYGWHLGIWNSGGYGAGSHISLEPAFWSFW